MQSVVHVCHAPWSTIWKSVTLSACRSRGASSPSHFAVVVRSLRVTGAAVGAEVARARRVTLYNVVTEARQVGVRVEASADVRLDRVRTTGGRVGVSFGAADDGSCPAGLALRSPGAVLVRSTFERATVGVAA